MTIVYRAQDLHQDGLHLQLVLGLTEPPSVRGEDIIVPSRAGRIAAGREADVRPLRLEGRVSGVDAPAFRIASDLFASLFDYRLDPDDMVLAGPYLGLPTGTTATIAARTLNAVGSPIRAWVQFWTVELESVAPDWTYATP